MLLYDVLVTNAQFLPEATVLVTQLFLRYIISTSKTVYPPASNEKIYLTTGILLINLTSGSLSDPLQSITVVNSRYYIMRKVERKSKIPKH